MEQLKQKRATGKVKAEPKKQQHLRGRSAGRKSNCQLKKLLNTL